MPRRPWAACAGTALAYALAGWLALRLALPSGYAAPLYPAAGIALAAAVTFGWPALAGAWLGSFAVNVALGGSHGASLIDLVVLPAVIALGASAQAAVGAALLRRHVAQPLVLSEPRDIARAGALAAGLACLVSATVATAALAIGGAIDGDALVGNWLTWWAGDTLGVLIAAPLALSLVGQPAVAWRPRRRALGIPLLAALALVAVALWTVAGRERVLGEAAFEREADRLAATVQQRLQLPVHALQTLHAAARASGRVDAPMLRAASVWWLAQGNSLQAMGYSERVAAADLAAFEAQARADGLPEFRVHHRDGGRAVAADGHAVVLRRIEPAASNRVALGVNALSVPEARAAIESSQRSGTVATTAGFRLTQSAGDETGVVLYQALGAGAFAATQTPLPGAPTGPTAIVEPDPRGWLGVLFVAVRTEALLAGLAAALPAEHAWCLFDPDAKTARPLLAGFAECGKAAGEEIVRTMRPVMLGGRALEVRLQRRLGGAPATDFVHWLLALAGVTATALLSAWLLTVSGLALRTRTAVDAATSGLRREVAERRLAEQERAASEARLRSILDNAPLGIAFLDPYGRLLQGNPRLLEMLGRTPQQLVGQTVGGITVPEDLPSLERDHHDLLSGKASIVRRQMRLVRRDGQTLTVRMACTALRAANGRVLHMVAVLEDLSEHLRLEEVERAHQRAEAASRAKSEFVSRMSHELRTPLNAMLGFAQLLGLDREPALPEHQRNWVQQIQRAGWHLLELVNDTLDLARIESGAVRLDLQPLDLRELVAGCADLVSAAATARGVNLELELPTELPAVAADATRLKQVITNLLSNAIKYNRERGRVLVRVRHTEGEESLALEVVDTGLGMTPAQLQRLFEPYNRLGRERSEVEGTGIGLVIARRLAEMMGGSLQAKSRAGKGSVFMLRLAVAAGPAIGHDEPAPTQPAPYRQRCVLYVEDNATNLEVMRGILLQRPQVRLEVAALGLDGLTCARRLRPDLILLDMQLPDITGPELLRHLVTDDELATIPVIVVSADASPARIEQALTMGAVHYVTKPVELAGFLLALDEVLESIDTRYG